jgi:hypothetical protein
MPVGPSVWQGMLPPSSGAVKTWGVAACADPENTIAERNKPTPNTKTLLTETVLPLLRMVPRLDSSRTGLSLWATVPLPIDHASRYPKPSGPGKVAISEFEPLARTG